jgi:hypothetical protein
MDELGFLVETLITVYCDNQSAIQVAENCVAHSKMKHVEKLHAHYLRQLVQENTMIFIYCRIDY